LRAREKELKQQANKARKRSESKEPSTTKKPKIVAVKPQKEKSKKIVGIKEVDAGQKKRGRPKKEDSDHQICNNNLEDGDVRIMPLPGGEIFLTSGRFASSGS
jgi:hypothetical protein